MFTGYNVNTNIKWISIKTINTEIRNNVLCKTIKHKIWWIYFKNIFNVCIWKTENNVEKIISKGRNILCW